MLCAHFVLPNHPKLVTPIVYVFEVLLYVFGIHISMLHADKPAVSAVAFLLVSPLLFYDRPARLSAMIAVVVAIFCGMVICFKDPDVAVNDVWNMVTFGVVGVATTIFIMAIKIRSLSQSRQIEYLSQTDLLTQTKNRNHYESRLQDYAGMGTRNVVCVYADVNGLHETNNELGHPTGDKMLVDVAATVRQAFGDDDTYRTGGDEFVAFRVDADVEEVSRQVERIERDLEGQGYNVSFGIAAREVSEGAIDMAALVSEAESNMFASKREFYESAEHDRRAR
jgi:diguanylate cyclase (GGDEF)-like protein